MLQGRSEAVFFTGSSGTPPDIIPKPDVILARPGAGIHGLEHGIQVRDPRESYLWNFFGTRLSEGGGWDLQGGRLEAITLPDASSLELYIVRVTRWHPAMFPLWGDHYGKSDVGFKVFLLKRKGPSSGATILRTWEIPPAQVEWEKDERQVYVDVIRPVTTASLAYDPEKKRAMVTITGITKEIAAPVDVDREVH